MILLLNITAWSSKVDDLQKGFYLTNELSCHLSVPLNPSLITGAFGVFSIGHSWFWALLTSGTQALTIKHEESKLSCLRYSSVRFLLVCINGALECSWAPQTPYPHHCCVKRGSLILSGLQILLWGPDCVETGKPTHRRLAGPLSVSFVHLVTQAQTLAHTSG